MPRSRVRSASSTRTANFSMRIRIPELQDDTEGQFGGLGLVVAMRDGTCHGHRADGRHAGFSRAGILSGDRIIKVRAKAWKTAVGGCGQAPARRPGSSVTSPSNARPPGAKKDYTLSAPSSRWTWSRISTAKRNSRSATIKSATPASRSSATTPADELEAALKNSSNRA
jgi:hypothetical protein